MTPLTLTWILGNIDTGCRQLFPANGTLLLVTPGEYLPSPAMRRARCA
jgi:hypothetical protein